MYLEYFVLGSCALLLLSFPIMFSAMFKNSMPPSAICNTAAT